MNRRRGELIGTSTEVRVRMKFRYSTCQSQGYGSERVAETDLIASADQAHKQIRHRITQVANKTS